MSDFRKWVEAEQEMGLFGPMDPIKTRRKKKRLTAVQPSLEPKIHLPAVINQPEPPVPAVVDEPFGKETKKGTFALAKAGRRNKVDPYDTLSALGVERHPGEDEGGNTGPISIGKKKTSLMHALGKERMAFVCSLARLRYYEEISGKPWIHMLLNAMETAGLVGINTPPIDRWKKLKTLLTPDADGVWGYDEHGRQDPKAVKQIEAALDIMKGHSGSTPYGTLTLSQLQKLISKLKFDSKEQNLPSNFGKITDEIVTDLTGLDKEELGLLNFWSAAPGQHPCG